MSQLDLPKFAVVICSRVNSKRLPAKAFREVNGKSVIDHLIDRLHPSFEVHLAVPFEEASYYTLHKPPFTGRALISCGSMSDPLSRMAVVANEHNIDYVIRITHDKIFIDPETIQRACDWIELHPLAGYLYTSSLVSGCGFEIIHRSVLNYAAQEFSNVEHISYAAKAACQDIGLTMIDFKDVPWYVKKLPFQNHRLLIDYPKDLKLMSFILSELGNDCEVKDVVSWLNSKGGMYSKINKLPAISIYTCAYNASQYIAECITSVVALSDFESVEYIIVNDGSTDSTGDIINGLGQNYPNIKIVTNEKNLGLSSSCNIALSHATSEYIMRLDADDYLLIPSIDPYISELSATTDDFLVPSFIDQKKDLEAVSSDENIHIGGSIFRTSAVNHIKFTDGLRGFDNLDFFKRSSDSLSKVFSKLPPLFFYRDTKNSLSKTNPKERKRIMRAILND